jgi:EAL domain-containing protein (putative c-di-GMP-specific phosphodiesterase class I)
VELQLARPVRQALVQRVQHEMAEAYTVCDHPIRLRVWLGAVADEHAAVDAQQLLQDAELALAEAQHAAQREAADAPHTVHYSPALAAQHLQRQAAACAFSQGLAANQFVLSYQPVIDLHSGQLAGVHAELSWQHPTRGQLLPAEFIDEAIEARCADALDLWQLQASTAQFAAWQRSLGASAPAWLSLALSPRLQPPLLARLTQQLEQAGLNAQQLELRWPAQQLAQDEGAAAALQALRDGGLRLALVGLGQASSSLSALPRWPVSTVHIDEHFVQQIESVEAHQVLVKAVVSLASSAGLATVADGISGEPQCTLLRELGVQLGLGTHFGPPVAAAEFEHKALQHRR